MTRLLVIADDLTGANDAGAQFAKHGVSTLIVMDWESARPEEQSGAAVIVVDTQSRHLLPDEAFQRVAHIARQARGSGIRALYKKTDSTLRGNIGAELAAIIETWDGVSIVYVPAVPAAQRVVRKGVVYVNGAPVAETYFAHDPLCPVHHSYLPDVIAAESDIPCEVVELDSLRKNAVDFRKSGRIFIVDGETDADLRKTAQILKAQQATCCFAGPAAFAEHLIGLLDISASPFRSYKVDGPYLAVNGSLNPVSLEQVNYGLQRGYISAQLTPEALFPKQDASSHSNYQERTAPILEALMRNEDVVVYTTLTEAGAEPYFQAAEQLGMNHQAASRHITRSLAQFVGAIMEKAEATLVIFGGETAEAILRTLNCKRFRIQSEISIGVNTLEAEVFNRNVSVITKSGGFGARSILEDIRKRC
jgi:uncharacterized protein YgbK (DUF1537 family)